ncbi:ATP-binding protein [Okeania hirsuta]|uniref:ATP-binding protein n=1 Tax=Okeania hirsuta TaxID=1458930 RepID=A0A3N6QTT7_9CYAN|nr:ATP-binding protein [Okeania hirsuta]
MFYGREDQIESLWEKVQAQPLVVVTAGSGTGKTSLVQAGLMPKIRTIGGSRHDEGNEGTATEDNQDVNQNWTVVSIPRAGSAPLTELTKVHLNGNQI